MKWLRSCIYCNEALYTLGDGMLKCRACKKKYSPERVNKIITLIDAYSKDENALQASKRLGLSYLSVQRFYESFRRLSAQICEDHYEKVRHKPCDYEEYFYVERSKRRQKDAVFDAQNFLTFDYEGHIYTLLMPSLKRYKTQFIEDNLESVYLKEFGRFKRNSRIIKLSSHESAMIRFWDYFEKAILQYKGVSFDAFAFYLKEIEFKFNHKIPDRQILLEHYYFKGATP